MAYTSPGVQVIIASSPALAPITSLPDLIAIVGPAAGSQSATDRLVLTGTTATPLVHTGVSTGSVVVTNAITGATVNPGAYVVTAGTDPDPSVTGDEPYTIVRFGTPATAPTVAGTGTGTLTGTYHYAVSFVNAAGETGVGPNSSDVVSSAAGYNLSAIPVGPTGTTARNIYREKVVSSVPQGLHLVATIADNTTLVLSNETATDVTANAAPGPVQGIASGDSINVTYTYTDRNYYQPTTLSNWTDITQKYGQPFDANGNILSALSFASRLAILNGANELVLVASPSSGNTDMTTAFTQLEQVTDVTIVLVAAGDSQSHSIAAAHCAKMNGQGFYRTCWLGRDGVSPAISDATMQSAAQGFNAEYVQLVSPASFQMINPITLNPLNIGGQWMAAALAGMRVARDPQIPLTRKSVAGFSGVNDKRTESQKAANSAAGLLVVENKGGVLRVRHDITTAPGNINTGEAAVVHVKYLMALRMAAAVDPLIGSVFPLSNAAQSVSSTVQAVLEQMLIEGAIWNYGSVVARLLQNSPTTVECAFEYAPAYPTNNIIITMSINTQNGLIDIVNSIPSQ